MAKASVPPTSHSLKITQLRSTDILAWEFQKMAGKVMLDTQTYHHLHHMWVCIGLKILKYIQNTFFILDIFNLNQYLYFKEDSNSILYDFYLKGIYKGPETRET